MDIEYKSNIIISNPDNFIGQFIIVAEVKFRSADSKAKYGVHVLKKNIKDEVTYSFHQTLDQKPKAESNNFDLLSCDDLLTHSTLLGIKEAQSCYSQLHKKLVDKKIVAPSDEIELEFDDIEPKKLTKLLDDCYANSVSVEKVAEHLKQNAVTLEVKEIANSVEAKIARRKRFRGENA